MDFAPRNNFSVVDAFVLHATIACTGILGSLHPNPASVRASGASAPVTRQQTEGSASGERAELAKAREENRILAERLDRFFALLEAEQKKINDLLAQFTSLTNQGGLQCERLAAIEKGLQ